MSAGGTPTLVVDDEEGDEDDASGSGEVDLSLATNADELFAMSGVLEDSGNTQYNQALILDWYVDELCHSLMTSHNIIDS
jgi:hypothetical protein